MKSSNEPWLEIDEDMYEVVVGNQQGLREFHKLIGQAIEADQPEFKIDTDGIAVEKIVITDPESYASKFPIYKETIWDKIVPVFFLIWAVVLPFVAIGFLVNTLFF